MEEMWGDGRLEEGTGRGEEGEKMVGFLAVTFDRKTPTKFIVGAPYCAVLMQAVENKCRTQLTQFTVCCAERRRA
ncbi:hypothetical protein STEG23_034854 [Scotinomys teguina]